MSGDRRRVLPCLKFAASLARLCPRLVLTRRRHVLEVTRRSLGPTYERKLSHNFADLDFIAHPQSMHFWTGPTSRSSRFSTTTSYSRNARTRTHGSSSSSSVSTYSSACCVTCLVSIEGEDRGRFKCVRRVAATPADRVPRGCSLAAYPQVSVCSD